MRFLSREIVPVPDSTIPGPLPGRWITYCNVFSMPLNPAVLTGLN